MDLRFLSWLPWFQAIFSIIASFLVGFFGGYSINFLRSKEDHFAGFKFIKIYTPKQTYRQWWRNQEQDEDFENHVWKNSRSRKYDQIYNYNDAPASFWNCSYHLLLEIRFWVSFRSLKFEKNLIIFQNYFHYPQNRQSSSSKENKNNLVSLENIKESTRLT